MAAIAAGERAALAALYRRCAPTLRRIAQQMLGALEADDVLHDVMIEVWLSARTYQPARSPVLAWIILRLRSRALDRIRSARYRRRADLDEVDAALEARQFATDDHPDGSYQRLRVRRVCAALCGEDRDLIERAFWQGLTCAESAAQLAVPVGTVKSRLRRVLRRLRGRSRR